VHENAKNEYREFDHSGTLNPIRLTSEGLILILPCLREGGVHRELGVVPLSEYYTFCIYFDQFTVLYN